ncbi:hypothetical protein ANTQUA_LOCUS411 [Anthophora quadrimaculata]
MELVKYQSDVCTVEEFEQISHQEIVTDTLEYTDETELCMTEEQYEEVEKHFETKCRRDNRRRTQSSLNSHIKTHNERK